MAVSDFFDRGWSMGGDRVAFRSPDRDWTYEEAGLLTRRIAHRLRSRPGVRDTSVVPARKVAVLSPNAPLPWICVLGAWRAGCVWVPLNPSSPGEDVASLVDRFDVDVLLYDAELADTAALVEARHGEEVECVALEHESFFAWLGDSTDAPLETPSVIASADPLDSVVAISATGGTTGPPKGVMNTHRSLSTMVAHQMLALPYPAGAPIVNLAAAPMTHTSGIMSLQTVARGGTVAIIPRATPPAIVEAVQQFGVTEMFLPPTVIYRLLSLLDEQDVDLSTLRHVLYGAAPMSTSKLREAIERLGPVLVEGFGLTEAPAAIAFLRTDEHLVDGEIAPAARLSSCGRPSPLVTVEIRDPETGGLMEQGQTGEVCVRGDLVMRGYYKDGEQTDKALRDGRLHTGDVGHLDAEGFLHLTDRLKDVIISGGFNVYPTRIEQVIWAHPSVEDCAVVGAPDDDWGERVTAVVQLKQGRTVTAAEIVRVCRENLGPVATPKDVIFVEALPRSANGKILKKDIRAEFWTGLSTRI